MGQVKMFCIPHAGGAATAYVNFRNYAGNQIDVRPIELAGRGRRLESSLPNTWEEAVNDLYHQIKDEIQEGPYMLFGHSMGSWLAYELYYKLLKQQENLPMHIVFSGNTPPREKEDKLYYSEMTDEVFIKEILKLGGTSELIFQNKELRELFLPILRADYKLIEAYQVIDTREPIKCNITLINGKNDRITFEDVEEWGKLTSGYSKGYFFEGGHFYVYEKVEEVMEVVKQQIFIK